MTWMGLDQKATKMRNSGPDRKTSRRVTKLIQKKEEVTRVAGKEALLRQ